MNRTELVQKGLKSTIHEREFALSVESLKEHFPDAEFHESDTFEKEIPVSDAVAEEGDEIAYSTVVFVKHKDVISFGEAVEVAAEEVITHIVTQEDLDNNPEFSENGVKVGDEITMSAKEDEATEVAVYPVTPKEAIAPEAVVETPVVEEAKVETPEPVAEKPKRKKSAPKAE